LRMELREDPRVPRPGDPLPAPSRNFQDGHRMTPGSGCRTASSPRSVPDHLGTRLEDWICSSGPLAWGVSI
jgi:hypothetical protein